MYRFLQRTGRGLVWVLTALTKLATAKQQAVLAGVAGSTLFIIIWPLAGSIALTCMLFVIGYLTEGKDHAPPDNR